MGKHGRHEDVCNKAIVVRFSFNDWVSFRAQRTLARVGTRNFFVFWVPPSSPGHHHRGLGLSGLAGRFTIFYFMRKLLSLNQGLPSLFVVRFKGITIKEGYQADKKQ